MIIRIETQGGWSTHRAYSVMWDLKYGVGLLYARYRQSELVKGSKGKIHLIKYRPCIVINCIRNPTVCTFSYVFILICTLHISNGYTVHHQEFTYHCICSKSTWSPNHHVLYRCTIRSSVLLVLIFQYYTLRSPAKYCLSLFYSPFSRSVLN